MNRRYKVENIKELIDKDGNMVNSKMKTTNPKIVSNTTTDDAISQSRQGMVWMNYRRFYGEDTEKLPYTEVADACSEDPKAFYDFLTDKGEEDQFNKYFIEDKGRTDESEQKMEEIVSDLVKRKYKMGFHENDDTTIDTVRESEPIIMKKLDKIINFILQNFDESQKDVVIKYINDNLEGNG